MGKSGNQQTKKQPYDERERLEIILSALNTGLARVGDVSPLDGREHVDLRACPGFHQAVAGILQGVPAGARRHAGYRRRHQADGAAGSETVGENKKLE